MKTVRGIVVFALSVGVGAAWQIVAFAQVQCNEAHGSGPCTTADSCPTSEAYCDNHIETVTIESELKCVSGSSVWDCAEHIAQEDVCYTFTECIWTGSSCVQGGEQTKKGRTDGLTSCPNCT